MTTISSGVCNGPNDHAILDKVLSTCDADGTRHDSIIHHNWQHDVCTCGDVSNGPADDDFTFAQDETPNNAIHDGQMQLHDESLNDDH